MPTLSGPRMDPQRLILTAALVALALLWLVPVVWVLVTSLKLSENIVRLPPEWIPWPATGSHYYEVLFSSSRTARIGRAFINSLVVSLGTVILVVTTWPWPRIRWPACASPAAISSSWSWSAA